MQAQVDVTAVQSTNPLYADVMIRASSNGTVKVCDLHVSSHPEHGLITTIEFVRGVAKEDECEPLFKEYKTCLTVRLFRMI